MSQQTKAMITNINTGVCHRRVQTGEPSFFVNWQEDGKNEYYFSAQRFMVESKKQQLLKQSTL